MCFDDALQLMADIVRLERSSSKTRAVLDQKAAASDRLGVIEGKLSKLRIWLKKNAK